MDDDFDCVCDGLWEYDDVGLWVISGVNVTLPLWVSLCSRLGVFPLLVRELSLETLNDSVVVGSHEYDEDAVSVCVGVGGDLDPD